MANFITKKKIKNALSYFIPLYNIFKTIPITYVKTETCHNVLFQIFLVFLSVVKVSAVSSYGTYQRMKQSDNPLSKKEEKLLTDINENMALYFPGLLSCSCNEERSVLLYWLYETNLGRLKHVLKGTTVIEKNHKKHEEYFRLVIGDYIWRMEVEIGRDHKKRSQYEARRMQDYKKWFLETNRGKYEIFFDKVATFIIYSNVMVFSVFSGYMTWMFIAGFTASLGWIVIPTLLAVITTWVISVKYGGQAISEQLNKMGRYFDNPTSFNSKSILYGIVALSALTTAPLLYTSFMSVIFPLLVKIGVGAALANPIGAGIVAGFVLLSVIGSISLVFRQMNKIVSGFKEHHKMAKEYKNEYSFFLMSTLKNMNPTEEKRLYIEKNKNGAIHYKILGDDGFVHDGIIALHELKEVTADQLMNDDIESFKKIRKKILKVTLKRGHTQKRRYGFFIAATIIGIILSIATITVAVSGDVLGFQKMLPMGGLVGNEMRVGFLIMNLIYNVCLNIADTIMGIIQFALCLRDAVEKFSFQRPVRPLGNRFSFFKSSPTALDTVQCHQGGLALCKI